MRQPCRVTVAFLIWPADVPWARPMRCFAFRLEPYPIRDRPSTYQKRYTQSPHPTDQIERLRFVPGRLMGLVVIPRPAVAGGIAERSLERRHARDALSVNPI